MSYKKYSLKDLTKKYPDFKANILGTLRKDKFQYLKKDDKLLEGDNVYVVISSDQLNAILNLLVTKKNSKNIWIIGGGNID